MDHFHLAPPLLSFRLPRLAERALVFLVLPLLGALAAHSLTGPPGAGPFGLLRVAEAPPLEVAGARAPGDALQDVAARLPLGASDTAPEARARTSMTDTGTQFTTPDGVTFRSPPGALAAPAAAAPAGATTGANTDAATTIEGVAGVTDEADHTQDAITASTVALSYRPLALLPAATPAPRFVHLFALSAAAADGRPVQTFSLPLTVSVPYEPQSIAGWLALAIYDPDADAWVELPVRAVNPRRATVSAQTYRPGVFALLENRPPLAAPDAAQTAANTPVTVDVLANDADPDGDPLAVFERTTSSAAGGEVRCAPTGACVYTPPTAFTGVDSFTYGLGDLRTHATGIQTWSDHTTESVVTIHVQIQP